MYNIENEEEEFIYNREQMKRTIKNGIIIIIIYDNFLINILYAHISTSLENSWKFGEI
jgi:hypothetical protein